MDKDLCLLSREKLAHGQHISVLVVSNVFFHGGEELDLSDLSMSIGEFSEEGTFDNESLEIIRQAVCDNMQGPWRLRPCILYYTKNNGTFHVTRLVPLERADILFALALMEKSKRKRDGKRT